jgi:hypothetical protein
MGSVSLAFSSFFKKSYMAGVGIVGFMFFCSVSSLILGELFGANPLIEGMNWGDGIHDLGKAIYKLEFGQFSTQLWQLIEIVLISTAGIWLIYRNIRPVEVVK